MEFYKVFEQAVKDTLGKFILTYWNSYNFFATYASLDKFNPGKDIVPIGKRQLLDKWILSRFHQTLNELEKYMQTFETHKAARAVEYFVVEDFSNWYLRRSRKRLWVEEKQLINLQVILQCMKYSWDFLRLSHHLFLLSLRRFIRILKHKICLRVFIFVII